MICRFLILSSSSPGETGISGLFIALSVTGGGHGNRGTRSQLNRKYAISTGNSIRLAIKAAIIARPQRMPK